MTDRIARRRGWCACAWTNAAAPCVRPPRRRAGHVWINGLCAAPAALSLRRESSGRTDPDRRRQPTRLTRTRATRTAAAGGGAGGNDVRIYDTRRAHRSLKRVASAGRYFRPREGESQLRPGPDLAHGCPCFARDYSTIWLVAPVEHPPPSEKRSGLSQVLIRALACVGRRVSNSIAGIALSENGSPTNLPV